VSTPFQFKALPAIALALNQKSGEVRQKEGKILVCCIATNPFALFEHDMQYLFRIQTMGPVKYAQTTLVRFLGPS
jgi:hypothetical protein